MNLIGMFSCSGQLFLGKIMKLRSEASEQVVDEVARRPVAGQFNCHPPHHRLATVAEPCIADSGGQISWMLGLTLPIDVMWEQLP
jgi:hypothetical protein